jgi:murein L,D-transpeptidase YcbB/YkuD
VVHIREQAFDRSTMRLAHARLRHLATGFLALVSAVPLRAQDPNVQDVTGQLKWRVEQLRAAGTLHVGGAVVASRELTLDAYERRGYLPLWTDAHAVASLLESIESVDEDGLEPEHYHLSALAEAARRARDASSLAERDLLATDAFVRLSHDLRFGKVEPDGPASGMDAAWTFGGPEAVARLAGVVTSGRIRETLADLRPHHFVYGALREALAHLRRIEAEGGWEPLPPGVTLARDSVGARVRLLRLRLRVSGDLRDDAARADAPFDSVLEAAVRSFQHRHGLNEDGVVGGGTLAALNVPVDRRIEQVRVNLERARWIARELPDTFVAVNVAGQRVYLMHGDSVAFETRAIVGTASTRTPLFTAPMLYIDVNPTWTVPPGIAQEVLEAIRSDPGYLEREGLRVFDGSGREVDAAEVAFARYTPASFRYQFRQDPGPTNPLGRIKLMLPNEHHVYLHDTPARGLFAEEERLFSHGCVRVEDPVRLAQLVLGDETWNRETLQAAIDSGETRTIRLTTPVDVFILYWTAAADSGGRLHFYRDVYDRDAAVLAALDAFPVGGTREGPDR